MNSMKIAYVCSQPVIGGLSWLMAYTAKNLIEKFGFDIEFFYTRNNNHDILEYLDENNIKYQISDKNNHKDFFIWLENKLDEFDPEIVHYGSMYWFSDILKKYRSFVFYSGQNDETIEWLVFHNKIDDIDRVICVSKELEELSASEIKKKSVVIKNSVDPKLFENIKIYREKNRKLLGYSEDDKVVVWNGRLFDKVKRPDILLRVIDRLRDENFKFMIFSTYLGIVDIKRKKEFDTLESENKNVSIFWNMKPWEIPEYMSCGDVYLHTSDVEGMSLSTIEAIMCGMKVVSRHCCGQKEVVEDLCDSVDEIVSSIKSDSKNKIVFDNNFEEYINAYNNLYKFNFPKTDDRRKDIENSFNFMINDFVNDKIFDELNFYMNNFESYRNSLKIYPFCIMSDPELKILYSLSKYCKKLFPDKLHLEIGSYSGGSMCYICNTNQHRCISIDTFHQNMKYSINKNYEMYKRLIRNYENFKLYYIDIFENNENVSDQLEFCKYIWNNNNIIDQIRFFKQKSSDAKDFIENNSYSFIYIDGNHLYEYALNDLLDYFDKCVSGGYIVLHDYYMYRSSPGQGVDLALYDFIYKYGYIGKIDNIFMNAEANNLVFIRKK